MGKVGVSTGTREVLRIILWMCYVVQLLVSSIYILLDLVTFVNLWQASGETVVDPLQVVYNNIWRAPLASCLLSALLTLSFNLLTCIVLIKKSINRSGPGFGYGFVLAYCFTLAFFCLLCSLVLDGFSDTVVNTLENKNTTTWTSSTTTVYTGTEAFGFICTALYLVFSLILVIFQAAVTEQLGTADEMRHAYAGIPTPLLPPIYEGSASVVYGEAADHQQRVAGAGGSGQQQQNYGQQQQQQQQQYEQQQQQRFDQKTQQQQQQQKYEGQTPGYPPQAMVYGQPGGPPAYIGGGQQQQQQQYYTSYENEGYEADEAETTEAQSLTAHHTNSSNNYRPSGATF